MESSKWKPTEEEREVMEAVWMQVKGACEKLKEETNAKDEHIKKMLQEMTDRYYSWTILKALTMIYKIIRHDKESDDITQQSFNSYDEAYDLLEEIYSDVCCSDADYGDRPYYEIIEVEEWSW